MRTPPPADPRHQRFAVLVTQGRYLADAYQEAGFQCSRATAYVNGHRLRHKPAVAKYIDALRRAAEKARREEREQIWKTERARLFLDLKAKLFR